jgi:hypothetical protein
MSEARGSQATVVTVLVEQKVLKRDWLCFGMNWLKLGKVWLPKIWLWLAIN